MLEERQKKMQKKAITIDAQRLVFWISLLTDPYGMTYHESQFLNFHADFAHLGHFYVLK